MRSGKGDACVMGWALAIEPTAMYLSALTVFELERGAMLVSRRDPAQGAVLRNWIDGNLMKAFEGRIVPVDADVARKGAALCVPDPRPLPDALIAATAFVHGMTVVTRNIADFAQTGVAVLNPWSFGQQP